MAESKHCWPMSGRSIPPERWLFYSRPNQHADRVFELAYGPREWRTFYGADA